MSDHEPQVLGLPYRWQEIQAVVRSHALPNIMQKHIKHFALSVK
ncbi:hypothetical protein [Nostoc sp. C052]|nr:hypothetical protein [Nostoc sp. C052]